MRRRRFLAGAAVAGIGVPLGALELVDALRASPSPSPRPRRPLPVPPGGVIRSAFTIGPGTNVIDLAGPWEVFQDAVIGGGPGRFELFTVAEDTATIEASGGLRIQPTYSFETAPQPHVVVVPAHQRTAGTLPWLRSVRPKASMMMSICTGAFVLAETGFLNGKTATTHHGSYADLAAAFPAVRVLRGLRYVEHDHVATAGGLTSGIDLALRVVERFLGRDTAIATARYMEYRRGQT